MTPDPGDLVALTYIGTYSDDFGRAGVCFPNGVEIQCRPEGELTVLRRGEFPHPRGTAIRIGDGPVWICVRRDEWISVDTDRTRNYADLLAEFGDAVTVLYTPDREVTA